MFSIDKIKQELVDEGDQLANWANMRGVGFFLKSDGAETQKALRDISAWIYLHDRYSDAAKQTFLAAADYRLIAHAIAIQATIVTFEESAPNSVESIKIPDVCAQFGVGCIKLWKLCKLHNLKLVSK